MSDDDIDYEIVTSATQLAAPPELRREKVILPEWRTNKGKAVAFWVWELSALEYGRFQESLRIYKNGVLSSVTLENEDLKYLAFCLRDASNNRLWNKTEDAIRQLGQFGKASTDLLVAAANRVNGSSKETQASAEGNSEKTPSDS